MSWPQAQQAEQANMLFEVIPDAPGCAEIPMITISTRQTNCRRPELLPQRAATGHADIGLQTGSILVTHHYGTIGSLNYSLRFQEHTFPYMYSVNWRELSRSR
eukprot:4571907-Pleurochrysis_carterae.AAC.1